MSQWSAIAIIPVGAVAVAGSLLIRVRLHDRPAFDAGPRSATLPSIPTACAHRDRLADAVPDLAGRRLPASGWRQATAIGTAFEEAALFPDAAPAVQRALLRNIADISAFLFT